MPAVDYETRTSLFYPHSVIPRLRSRFMVTTFLVLLLICTTTLHLFTSQQNPTFCVFRPDQAAYRLSSRMGESGADTTRQPDVPPRSSRALRVHKTRRRLPGCIIIGVRKGGTRALLEYLNIHPDVSKAADEVHFFNNNTRYRLGLDWYRRQMPFTYHHQITVEKTPAYFTTESVPPRVQSMNATIKLLLIVRDPVTRLVSDYAQLAANKAKRVKVPPSFERQVILSDGTINTDYKAVRSGMYYIYFQQWLEFFPRAHIHVVDGDLMVKDPVTEMRRVESFLGIKPVIESRHFAYNKTKGFYCTVKNGTLARCLNDSKGRPHPKVSLDVVKKLREFYAPHNREFYKLVGKNFEWPEE